MINFLKELFGKNKEQPSIPLETINMKIKVTKNEPPSPFSGDYSKSNNIVSGTTTMKQTGSSNANYINIYNNKIFTHSDLKYIGISKQTGYPIYELLSKNILSTLKQRSIKYVEVIMTPNTLSTRK